MKPRTFARRPSSIGSNQLSKSRPSTSSARAVVILLIMAWSPARRSNAGIRVANPGDYATQFQPPPRQHLGEVRSRDLVERAALWTGEVLRRLGHGREESATPAL